MPLDKLDNVISVAAVVLTRDGDHLIYFSDQSQGERDLKAQALQRAVNASAPATYIEEHGVFHVKG